MLSTDDQVARRVWQGPENNNKGSTARRPAHTRHTSQPLACMVPAWHAHSRTGAASRLGDCNPISCILHKDVAPVHNANKHSSHMCCRTHAVPRLKPHVPHMPGWQAPRHFRTPAAAGQPMLEPHHQPRCDAKLRCTYAAGRACLRQAPRIGCQSFLTAAYLDSGPSTNRSNKTPRLSQTAQQNRVINTPTCKHNTIKSV